jgi:diacylglycerol kinase
MEPEEIFSIRGRIKSFSYAIAGLRQFIIREHNARLHVVATVGVVIAGFVFRVSYGEAAILTVVTALVWITEIFNTCVERLADMITRERHPSIKIIKDLSAGAVLTAAIVAVVAALFIFIPKII